MRRIGHFLALGFTLLAQSAPADDSIESKLRPLIDAHKGKVAVATLHLDTGETYRFNAETPMPTASLIKFPIMIETYRQAAEGKVDLARMVTLHDSDKVPGSGILTDHFSEGATFSLRDAVRIMIVYSDNTATNLVIDAIGLPATADTMEKFGFPNTKLHSKVYRRDTSVFPDRSPIFGLGSTTADDMVALCAMLHRRELVSPEASEAMLNHMLKCEDPDKFPRFLPKDVKMAFKTGSVNAARTIAGILQTPSGPVALCVLTNENEDQRWDPDNAGDILCAKVVQAVYEHYSPPPAAPSDESP